MTYTKFLSRTTTAATTTTIANNITPTYYAKKVVVLVRTKILFAVLFVSIFWIVHVVDSQQQQQQDEKKDDDDVVVDNKDDNDNENDEHIVQCGVWLAPSTIVGAGLGMFAGKDFMEHDEILPSGDSMVAIVDIELHRANNPEWDQTLPFLWDEYVWAHTLIPSREGFGTVSVASPGLGSAANSFLPLYNVEEGHSTKDATGLHRSRDPGVGSFSYYHNRISTAKSDIVIGQELFVTYGEQWFQNREHFGPIPLLNDMDSAQYLLSAFSILRMKVRNHTLTDEVWKVFVQQTMFTQSRIFGAFNHSDPNEISILLSGTTSLEGLRTKQSIRSIDWLRQYGTCGDHIVSNTSTIRQAGRGAFATRNLPVGTIVAQLPMIHIPDRSILDMYHFVNVQRGGDTTNDDPTTTTTNRKVSFQPNKYVGGYMGQQLLLNYCYGHRHSTLLLCPYGPLTNYINHNQTLANVKIQWGRSESGNHNTQLLQKTLSTFSHDKTAKLAMDIVSIRPIKEGDEIFLDYGDEWEDAWNEHINTWKPVIGAEQYMSGHDFNTLLKMVLPTIFEQLDHRTGLFPPNVELYCDYTFTTLDSTVWKEHLRNNTMERYLLLHNPVDFWKCIILRKSYDVESDTNLYTVHMYKEPEEEDENQVDDNKKKEVKPIQHVIGKDLPQHALRFFDTPYTDDTFLPNAFRHDIRIPDDIFPNAWKNKL